MHCKSAIAIVPCLLFLVATRPSSPARAEDGTGRPPWTTSRIAGTPEPPPPYRVEVAYPRLKFDRPVALAAAKGLDRVFVLEVGGKVLSFPNRADIGRADLAVDLSSPPVGAAQVFGMAFHPDFATHRHVYLCYTTRQGGPDGTHVSRFDVSADDPPRIVPASERLLLTWQAGGHNAGCLAFGPDGCLYIAAGDTADPTPPDPLATGQDIGDIPSSILRIDVDRADPGKSYRVPPDNPFVGLKGARPEVWAFGFRNPWRMSFDRKSGDLWAGDVGWELWEMIHRVERGGNYGWSIMEGPQPVRPEGKRGPGPILPPVISHPHSEAASITGGYVYRGRRLPDLVGVYIYGDFQSGKIWGLRHDGRRITWQGELADSPLQLVSFGEDNEGEVYALDFERSQQVYRLAPNPVGDRSLPFPKTLSATGLFASTRDLAPASGVVPYGINAELWSDNERAERLVGVPGSGHLDVDDSGRLKAPDGSVLARTVTLELERGNPRSLRRLETQVLHLEAGAWRPYTYIWSDDQSDATLADAAGSSRSFTIRDARAPGGVREQTHRYASRSECVICHNPWVERQTTVYGRQSASPLAFTTDQLDRKKAPGEDQLARLRRLGLLGPKAARASKPLADPYDPKAPLDARARSYLQVNCAHCHQFGAGGSANIFLQASASLDKTRAVGTLPIQGSFGIADARIIAPGDPDGSVLYYRIAKTGGGRMPRIGSGCVDEAGVALIRDWIAAMPRSATGPPSDKAKEVALTFLRKGGRSTREARAAAIATLTDATRSGLMLMDAIDRKALDESAVREVVARVGTVARPEVRDLFERFLPDADRARRLGEGFDPAAILGLKGRPDRGERLFAADSTQCAACHKVGGKGSDLGPALDAIGSKYDRPALLRQIVEPSLAIEPKYVNYLLEQRSGTVQSGILVEKDDRHVLLRDAKNQPIRVDASDVERLVPQPKSLMPESLLREMTPQQAADLLDYLATLKAKAPPR